MLDRLHVAKKAHSATISIYGITKQFPSDERYGLSSQLRRASSAIGSNLAEGEAHPSRKVFARHVGIALGSTAEVQYQLTLSADLGYLSPDENARLQMEFTEVRRMLVGLLGSLH